MKRQKGFTLIELMVVIAILGILSGSMLPLLGLYKQRALGSEAQSMFKQIMEAEIMYYLEHNKFFPDNATYTIIHTGAEVPAGARTEIKENLNITIPVGHRLDFSISADNFSGLVVVTISSSNNSPIFGNGDSFIRGNVDDDGKIEIM
jgi:prepilin-type N-terminal cleavage/methylation domain-containing protein